MQIVKGIKSIKNRSIKYKTAAGTRISRKSTNMPGDYIRSSGNPVDYERPDSNFSRRDRPVTVVALSRVDKLGVLEDVARF